MTDNPPSQVSSDSAGGGLERPIASLGYVIFYVPDVAAALEFYVAAFGFTQRFVTPENDYGELDTGTTTLAFVSHELATSNLSDAGGFVALDSAERPFGGSITVVTPDVDASLTAALSAGAQVYAEPKQKPWGQTVAYALDPFGLLIEIATAMG